MSFSLRQIRYFVATAELGQISQAAIALSISQSAVTTAIRDLERHVGLDLFNRTPLGMDLTVAATYTVMGYFLPHHIQRLKRSYPGLDIHLFELNREAIEEGLTDRRYDIALALTSNIANPSIATETMMSSPRRLWLSSRHRFLSRAHVGLKEVAEEPYIMLTVDEAAQTAMKYWSQSLYRPRVTLRTSSVEAVRSMVAGGEGVAILSDMVYRPWSLEGERLETMVLADPMPPMNVGLAWHRDATFSDPMRALRTYFQQAFNRPITPAR
jgi:DNA-binding transcriptional LysR family regulator